MQAEVPSGNQVLLWVQLMQTREKESARWEHRSRDSDGGQHQTGGPGTCPQQDPAGREARLGEGWGTEQPASEQSGNLPGGHSSAGLGQRREGACGKSETWEGLCLPAPCPVVLCLALAPKDHWTQKALRSVFSSHLLEVFVRSDINSSSDVW